MANGTGVELTTQPVDPSTGLDLSKPRRNRFTPSVGTRYTTSDPAEYSRFFDQNVHLEFGADYLDPLRAARQSGFEQLGAGLLQAGIEVLGGTIEGIGHLETGVRELLNLENDWSNWLVDIGTGMKTWGREAAPIYQDPKDIGKFRPQRWSWWMSNAPSIASTLSLMIPSSGIVKGASLLGKGMGISNSMGKTARFMTTSVGQAAASRLMENGMESVQTYETTYEQLLDMGVPEQEARRAASIAASDTWNKNWVLIAQDILQYRILGSGFGKTTAAPTRKLGKKIGLGKKAMRNITTKRGQALLGDALSEGGEEVFQYIVSDRATHLARATVDHEYDYKPSLREYLGEGELWSSFTMGALGSTVFQTAGRKINRMIQGAKDPRVDNAASWAPDIQFYRDAFSVAKASGIEAAMATSGADLAIAMAEKASPVQNIGQLRDVLNNIHEGALDPKAAKSLDIKPQDQKFIVENYPAIIENVNQVANAYETYTGKYENDIAARLAGNDVRRKNTEGRIKQYEDNRAELLKKIPQYEDMSTAGKEIVMTSHIINTLRNTRDGLQERLKTDKELSKEEQKAIKKDINRLDERILNQETIKNEQTKARTKEEAKADSELNIQSADLDNYLENEDKIHEAQGVLRNYNAYDEFLRKSQTKRKKEGNKAKYKSPDLASDDPADNQMINPELTAQQDIKDSTDIAAQQKVTELEHEEQMAQQKKQNAKKDVKENKPVQEKNKKQSQDTGSKVEPPAEPQPKKTEAKQTEDDDDLDALVDPDAEDIPIGITVDEEGNVIKLPKDKKETKPEPVTKDQNVLVQSDEVTETINYETMQFDDLKDSYIFINFGRDKNEGRTEAQIWLDNPKSKLGSKEMVFTVAYGEYFDKELGDQAADIRQRIESGDETLLQAGDRLDAIVDRIPILVKIRSKANKKELNGSYYVYRSAVKPPKATKDIQKKVQASTRALRQKILEGLINKKEVTYDGFKRSVGVPNNTKEQQSVHSALNVDPAQVTIGMSRPGGNIEDPDGNILNGKAGNPSEGDRVAKGGNMYAYSQAPNGKRMPIHLNNAKLSREHAELVFEAYEQAAKADNNYSIEFSDTTGTVSKMTVGQLINALVYSGFNNTAQIPTSERYRPELVNKQLYMNDKGYLRTGTIGVNLRNYTPQQKEEIVSYLTENMNYIVRLNNMNTKIGQPFRIGSIEVTKNDLKAEMAYKELYLRNNYLTTDVVVTEDSGSAFKNSNAYVEFSTISDIKYNDRPAESKEVQDKKKGVPLFITKDMKQQLLDKGYSRAEIGKMTAQEAHEILNYDPGATERKDINDFTDDIMGLPRTRLFEGGQNYEVSDIQSEVEWIRDRLGDNVPLEVVDDFIKIVSTTGTHLAYGQFKDGAIKLYKHAEKGTGYHEAFHKVFRDYLTYEERERILDEASKRYGIERSYTHREDENPRFSIAENRVNFVLKVADLLRAIAKDRATIRLNTKERPYLEKNLRKNLAATVPAEQIDFIFDYMKENDISAINTEDLAVKLASEFAHIVESGVTKSLIAQPADEQYDAIRSDVEHPSSFYENLIVPGGTNYTENEIRTPDITPIIKGHARFATDKGIGWFRSDEQRRYLTEEQLKEEWVLDNAGNRVYIGQKYSDTKVRRILEIQSDLFQKGRDRKYLAGTPSIAPGFTQGSDYSFTKGDSVKYKGKYYTVDAFYAGIAESVFLADENQFEPAQPDYLILKDRDGKTIQISDKEIAKIEQVNKSENKFLQLLNKDGNWIKFFIQTIIQDSAKRGYEKVLFPKGETAAKIEGHQTIADDIKRINKELSKLKTESYYDLSELERKQNSKKIKELESRKQELKAQGIKKLKPIEGFYEIRVGNILKKIDPNVATITDKYGNQWYEYKIDYEDKITDILLRTEESYYKELPGDVQLEEKLAEEFRNYVLTEKKVQPEPGILRRFFRKLYNFIRDIFVDPKTKVQDITIEGIFNRIERGEYKKTETKPDKLPTYTDYEVLREVEGFTSDQLHAVTKQLMYLTVTTNNVVELKDVKNISYAPLKKEIRDIIARADEHRAVDPNYQHFYDIFTRVLNNFDTFTGLLDDMLLSMKIRKVEEFDNDITINEFDKHIKESYEYSSRDNMLANVKLFLATIPSDERDSFTKMRTIVDFDKAWKKIMRDMHDASSVEEMMDRVAKKADNDMFYEVLLNGAANRPGLKTGTENFRTQFFTSIKTHKHHFIKLWANSKKKQYTWLDAEMKTLSQAKVDGWSITFAEDLGLFHETTKRPISTEIRKVIGNYEALVRLYTKEYKATNNQKEVKHLDLRIANIITIFNMIGIDMDKADVLEMLYDKGGNLGDALHAFISQEMKNIFDGKVGFLGQLVSLDKNKDVNKAKLFQKSKSISKIGDLLANRDEDNVASVVLGPNGNKYYLYAANSFLTDYINNLGYDDNFLNNLQNSAGKRNSLFLAQLQEGAEISFSTLLGYKEGKDTTGYFDMEPDQDYLMKATALLDGMLPMPTISNKKFYGFLNGLTKVVFTPDKESGQIEGAYMKMEGNNLRYQFPERVYEVFEGYYQDELDRIEKVKSDVDLAEADLQGSNPQNLYKSLVENYHFNGYTEEGLPMLKDEEGNYTGNGARLIDFKEFETKEFNRENLKEMFRRLVDKEIRKAIKNNFIRASVTPDGAVNYKTLGNKRINRHWMGKSLEQFGKQENRAVYNIMSDIALNSVIASVEVTKLLSMDPAFYNAKKGDIYDDVTKRLAELVAPGQNLRTNFTSDQFNAGVMESDEYTVGTIRSHEFSSDVLYEELVELFKEDYKKTFPGLTTIEIDNLAHERLEGYKKIDSTDGQAYISPNLYRQIAIRIGEWDDIKNAAFERIMRGDQDSLAAIQDDVDVVMQPLKMVYYGLQFTNGNAVPIYDKMSLAVILPQMAKGTKLQELYDLMTDESKPIGMIKFDSVVKAGTTPTTDYINQEGKVNKDFRRQIVSKKQTFKYLRRQQITDPHTEDRRMVGTQVKKIIMQNLHAEAVYELNNKKLTGREVSDLINKLYSALSDKGRQRLERILNIKDNKVDEQRIRIMLKNAATVSGAPYNIIDSLVDNKELGTSYAHLDTMPDRRWAETRITSKVGKETVDVITAGDSFIQMTAYGMAKPTSERADDLKLMDEQGRTEVRLSVGLFRDVIPNYDKLTFAEKREWLKENFEGIGYRIPTQSQGSVIAMVVKDFLPEETSNVIQLPLEFTRLTGSDFDIDKLFLMRKSYYTDINEYIQEYKFIEGDAEGLIRDEKKLEKIYQQHHAAKLRAVEAAREEILEAPEDASLESYINILERRIGREYSYEIKQYAIENDVEKLTKEEISSILAEIKKDTDDLEDFIDKNKGASAFEINHPKAMENLVVDVMKSVLTSDAHIVDTKTPIDAHTQEVKDVLEDIDNIRGTSAERSGFEWHLLSTQSEIKQYYIGGQYGISPFALHNVHHALTQVSNVGIHTMLNAYSNSKFKAKEQAKHNLAKVYDKHGKVITDWFSALINGHVDIANDPYVFRLNINRDTYDQLSYLLRLGFGKTALYFLNQPSIINQPDSRKSEQNSKSYFNQALVLGKEEKIEKKKLEQIRNHYASLKYVLSNEHNLRKQINSETKHDAVWYAIQAGIAQAYGFMSAEAAVLTELVQLTRIDGKNYGNNIGEIRFFDRRIQDLMTNDKLINARELINNTFLGTVKENSIDLIQNVFTNLTVSSTDNFVALLDVAMTISNKPKGAKARAARTSKVSNELFTSLVSQYYTAENGKLYKPEDIGKLIYGDKATGRKLHKLKKRDGLSSNMLLDILIPYYDESQDAWLIYTRADVANDTWTRNGLVSAWKELLTSKDKEVRELARELMDYSFYLSGFNKRLFSFYHHIPITALMEKPENMNESISYDDFIGQLKKELSKEHLSIGQSYNIVRDIMLNNDYIIPELENFESKPIGGKNIVFTIRHKMNLATGVDGQITGAPFIKFHDKYDKQVIGEYIGYVDNKADSQKRFELVYKIVEPKGFEQQGHVFSEYGTGERSIVPDNQRKNYLEEEGSKEILGQVIDNFVYVEPIDRLTPYNDLVKNRRKDVEKLIQTLEGGDPNAPVPVTKVISGMQTGVDTIGLEVANELGIETGGTATPGFYTEKGKLPDVAKKFNVEEITEELQAGRTGKEFYLPRTEQNVKNSDGTVYFATDEDSAGKAATKRYAKKYNKPFLLNPATPEDLKAWLNANNIQTLNIAGNRGTKLTSDDTDNIRRLLNEALTDRQLDLPAVFGYDGEETIYVDVPEATEEAENIEDLQQGEIQELEQREFENRLLLDDVREKHGEEEYMLAKQALDNYNTSTAAKKLWDKLKECL